MFGLKAISNVYYFIVLIFPLKMINVGYQRIVFNKEGCTKSLCKGFQKSELVRHLPHFKDYQPGGEEGEDEVKPVQLRIVRNTITCC